MENNKFLREGDKMQRFKQPLKQGLYDPKFEHDACGIGMIAHLKRESFPPNRKTRYRNALPLRTPWFPRWG